MVSTVYLLPPATQSNPTDDIIDVYRDTPELVMKRRTKNGLLSAFARSHGSIYGPAKHPNLN